MRFRFLRPLHGWREFTHEIVIVIIGVLLALAGAQAIDSLRWRSDVQSFRNAVDHELGRNLGVFEQSMVQRPCAARRLKDLEHFLADSAAGRQDKMARPIGRPFIQTGFFRAWDNKGSDVVSHLPLKLRLQYGELYDEFRNNETVHLNERDVWRSLSQFQQPEPLDHADRMRMRELLNRAEQFNDRARSNYEYMVALARPLGIRSISDPELKAPGPADSFCQPLLVED